MKTSKISYEEACPRERHTSDKMSFLEPTPLEVNDSQICSTWGAGAVSRTDLHRQMLSRDLIRREHILGTQKLLVRYGQLLMLESHSICNIMQDGGILQCTSVSRRTRHCCPSSRVLNLFILT